MHSRFVDLTVPFVMLPNLTRINSSKSTSPFWFENLICPLGSTRAVIRPLVIDADRPLR